jgi:hypothetical protein
MRPPREGQIFKYSWLYPIGLFAAVALVLMYFWLNPSAETPAFP